MCSQGEARSCVSEGHRIRACLKLMRRLGAASPLLLKALGWGGAPS